MQLNRQDQQMKVKLYSIHVPSASKYCQILEIQKSNSLLFSGLKRLRIHKLSININVIKNSALLIMTRYTNIWLDCLLVINDISL